MQCPYYVHKALVPLFGLPLEKVRIIQTETGGGFGGKEEYPSMIAGHAALLAWKSGKPVKIIYDRAEDIAAIECVVPELELALICEPFEQKLRPATPYAAKFSLPFLLAARIADGAIGHRTFETANLSRPDLLALAARVKYRVARPGEMPFPKAFPGLLEAVLADGRKLVERLDVNAGHPDNPLAFEQVAAKFEDNAVDVLGHEGVRRAIDLAGRLPEIAVADLAAALVPPANPMEEQPTTSPRLHAHK
jgi:2-methylcitrate dehydratase PrpD